MKENAESLKRLKKEACKSLKPLHDAQDLEIDINDVYRPSSVLDMPIRPSWSYEMTKEQLDEREKNYFNVGCFLFSLISFLNIPKKKSISISIIDYMYI